MSFTSRMVGIMLCGKYAPGKKDSFYIACNMHWEDHELALPKLARNRRWVKIADTSLPVGEQTEGTADARQSAESCEMGGTEEVRLEESVITVGSRCIAVFKTITEQR